MSAPKGIILLKGKVENLTPLHIGSGNDDKSDMDILLNSDGLPYIPATAFVGILLHSIKSSISPEKTKTEEWKWFWGNSEIKKDQKKGQGIGYQSHFQSSDLLLDHNSTETFSCNHTTIRDGIKIDNSRGMVKDKYDYELLDIGAVFDLKAKFSFGDSDRKFVEEMVSSIISRLTHGSIWIGGMTNSGFGQIRLIPDTITLYLFDFRKKEDALAWLFQDFSKKVGFSLNQLPEPVTMPSEDLRIKALFQLKNSLIIRSYSADPKYPDAVPLKSNNKWIVPGTSLKGAIRARAERIAKTISPNTKKAQELINGLFGMVTDAPILGFLGENEPERRMTERETRIKGKVRIREIVLPDYKAKIQTRIQIDRFTGGAIDGKLLKIMPLFPKKDNPDFEIEITVSECRNEETGLLLLVLKDLWSGDLAIGGEKNVGRGVLKGIQATIHYKGERLIIPEDIRQIDKIHESTLQGLVEELNKCMKTV